MKKITYKESIIGLKPILFAIVLLLIFFYIFVTPKKNRRILYKDEVTCYVTKKNSYSRVRLAINICDSLRVPKWTEAIYLPDSYKERMQGKDLDSISLLELQNVPFPYELSKKKDSDTIMVVTKYQDTLLFYLEPFSEEKTPEGNYLQLFTDPKQYFKDVFKIKEE